MQPSDRAARRPSSLRWGVGAIAAQVVVAFALVDAPRLLVLATGGLVVVLLVMWGLSARSTPVAVGEGDTGGSPTAASTARAPARPPPLPAAWAALVASFAVFILDIQGIFTHGDGPAVSPLRYLLLPVPLAVVALSARRVRVQRPIPAIDVFLAILLVWGLTASLVFKFLSGGDVSGLSIFLPMPLALLPWVQRGGDVTEASARRLLDLLSYLGLAYVLVHLAASIGVPLISRGAHGHQEAYLLAMAVVAAFTTGRRKLALFELAAIAAIYLIYPAATYVTTAATVLLTMLLISRSRGGVRTLFIGLVVPVILVLGFSSSLSSSNDSFVNTVLPKYFAAIGKSDNSAFRREMLRLGIEQVRAHPLIGADFTSGFALPTKFRVNHQVVPPHNDFLELALAGGLLALGLFLAWALGTNVYIIRRHRRLLEEGAVERARLVRTLLIAFNACLSVGLFQPVLFELGTVTLFFLIAASMRVAAQGDDGDPDDGGVNGGRPADVPVPAPA